MYSKRFLWDVGHIIIFRDIIGPIRKRKYYRFGKRSRIFKPIVNDSGSKYTSIGHNSTIGKYVRIECYANNSGKRGRLIIGNDCRIGNRSTFLCGEDIVVGNSVLVASDVLMTSENHSIDPECSEYYMSQPLICKRIIIEDGCWIGEKACILPGVTIGKKAIIGAGAIVTRSIPDYSIAVGNPAKVIKRYSFDSHSWIRV